MQTLDKMKLPSFFLIGVGTRWPATTMQRTQTTSIDEYEPVTAETVHDSNVWGNR